MQGREVGWTLHPNWSVAVALEPEPVLERAWMLILGQQAWPEGSVLSVQRLPRHWGIRCPAYTFQLGTDNALPFAC